MIGTRLEGKMPSRSCRWVKYKKRKKEQTIAGSSDDENIYDWIVNIPMTTGPCPDCGSAMTKANIRDLCGVFPCWATYIMYNFLVWSTKEPRERYRTRFDDLAYCRNKIIGAFKTNKIVYYLTSFLKQFKLFQATRHLVSSMSNLIYYIMIFIDTIMCNEIHISFLFLLKHAYLSKQ